MTDLAKEIRRAVEEEREACAKIAETTVVLNSTHPCLAHYDNYSRHCATVRAEAIAAAIRRRGR